MVTEVKPQLDIDAEIRELEARKKKLASLIKLRAQVTSMELQLAHAEAGSVAVIVIEAAAKHFGVSVDGILSRSRRGRLVEARHVAMYLIRNLTEETSLQIGRMFNRDHGSVLYAVAGVEDRMGIDFAFTQAINTINEMCKKPLEELRQAS